METNSNIFTEVKGQVKKEGIPIEKGAALTEDWVTEHYDLVCKYCQFFSAYPDLFLDIVRSSEYNFTLYFYQRILLRVIMRFQEVYGTAPRAFSKSFLTILGLFLECIFTPRSKRFITAPAMNQAARIAKEKLTEIFTYWPILKKEVVGREMNDIPGNYGE